LGLSASDHWTPRTALRRPVILPLPGGEGRGEGGRGRFPQGLDSAFLKWEENWNFLNKINHFHKKWPVIILVVLDFPVCRIAGFPTRRPSAHRARPTSERPADWEIGDTAGWETCGTHRPEAQGAGFVRARQKGGIAGADRGLGGASMVRPRIPKWWGCRAEAILEGGDRPFTMRALRCSGGHPACRRAMASRPAEKPCDPPARWLFRTSVELSDAGPGGKMPPSTAGETPAATNPPPLPPTTSECTAGRVGRSLAFECSLNFDF
jgi:hypothetical protein